MTAIVPKDEPRPRGTRMGRQVGGPPLDEAGNFFRCDKCDRWFDARDLAWVEDHEGTTAKSAVIFSTAGSRSPFAAQARM
jgi:hypothetical protein